jgi:phosphocarrier protein
MPSREVAIVNKLGLHLRAAAALVTLADTFPCKIYLVKDGQKSNGKSILSILSLGAPCGEKIVIETSGDRAAEALDAVAGLIADRFGEPE